MTKKDMNAMIEFIKAHGIEPYKAQSLQVLNIFNSMILSDKIEQPKLIIENEVLYKSFLILHINNHIDDNMDDYIINYLFIMFKNRWPKLTQLFPLGKDIKGLNKTGSEKRMYIFNAVWYTDVINDPLLNYIYNKEKLEDLKSDLLRRYVNYE